MGPAGTKGSIGIADGTNRDIVPEFFGSRIDYGVHNIVENQIYQKSNWKLRCITEKYKV